MLIAKETHRKYHNAKTYHTYKEGKLQGIFPVEWKMSEEEEKEFLEEIKELSGADTIILYWTALTGIVEEEIEL